MTFFRLCLDLIEDKIRECIYINIWFFIKGWIERIERFDETSKETPKWIRERYDLNFLPIYFSFCIFKDFSEYFICKTCLKYQSWSVFSHILRAETLKKLSVECESDIFQIFIFVIQILKLSLMGLGRRRTLKTKHCAKTSNPFNRQQSCQRSQEPSRQQSAQSKRGYRNSSFLLDTCIPQAIQSSVTSSTTEPTHQARQATQKTKRKNR